MKKMLVIAMLVLGTGLASASDFCDGWDEGYQDALEECLRVGVTPVCPIEPINSKGYKTGYGRGYGAAKATHCN